MLKSKFNRRPNKILDLACGTGLFGEELLKHIKSQIYGADISEKSLIIAKEKNYKKLFKKDFEKKINFQIKFELVSMIEQ